MRKDDLFSDSTAMSFGEHLEELRNCLIYAIIWLVVGTVFGFFLGGPVVEHIQRPLKKSLENYHLERGTGWLETHKKELLSEGQNASIIRVPKDRGLTPTEFWIFPGELERALDYQRKQEALTSTTAGTEQPMIALDEVDNFALAKKARDQRRKKQAEGAGLLSHAPTTDYDAEPVRLILWTAIKDDARVRSKTFNAQEAFSIYLKASLLVGFVLASPGIFYHLWSFVAAGLYPHEKKYIYLFMPISIILFIAGSVFAFFIVFQFILEFLFWFNSFTDIEPEARINEWLNFALLLPIGFGISFQLPLVMFVLERVHIFSVQMYLSQWRIAVLAIFVISMLLTPADPWSMILMAIPLTFLYFAGIWMCKMFPRKELYEDAED
ncbi:MAG TPA: twin-arginine translocase subunit TatC [Planctomycetaceae bacterium]|nr:twin-arginine translocase subunit TatC [Planctomycetaceae bacterium]